MIKLTAMQKRYIWLAGSFSKAILVQGRGYRSRRTMYAISDDESELTVFGYSSPCYFMERRGIFRAAQAPGSYILTDEGERLFRELALSGVGMTINQEVREVKLAATVAA